MSNWRHSGIVVREARLRDLDAIARLENESFETDRVSRRSLTRIPARGPPAGDRGDHRRRTGRLRAGLAAQDLAGACASIRSRSTPASPAAASAGRCCTACEAYARRHRRAALTLEVRYDNSSAIALYESSGFRQFGEHARYYADGATALRYEKSLDPRSRRETGNNPPPERVRPLRGASRPR